MYSFWPEELLAEMTGRPPRREEDVPEFLCGLNNGRTCGAPITAIIHNRNIRKKDYENLRSLPRPGHADYTAQLKYDGYQDASGGGHFSGRLTAPLCIAGGLLMQMLALKEIHADARITALAGITDDSIFTDSVGEKEFPVVSDVRAEEMKHAIEVARAEGDSVGGIIECVIRGVPGGIGNPMFDGVENRIAQLAFAVPAVKAIEFGDGFASAGKRGSENNDGYEIRNGRIRTITNHAGGILGGITNGEDIIFRVAVKPTPSISHEQRTVNIDLMQQEKLFVPGRHDPCIVPRAVPVIEAVAAIAVSDLLLGR